MFKAPLTKKELFSVFIWLFLGQIWLALILTFLGIFYPIIIFLYVLGAGLLLGYLIWKNFSQIKPSKSEIFFLSLVLFFIILFSFFSQPTIFSGRDQGSLSESAIRLSQNHRLTFSSPATKEFFEIYPTPKCPNDNDQYNKILYFLKQKFWCGVYGPGQALNFPGFSYKENGDLITHFPLGYIVWLASFFSLFGIFGLIIANGVSFFVFSCAFYLLAKKLLSPFSALLTWVLSITVFTSFWFFKFTLSENLALALVWLGIYFFVLFWDNPKKSYFILSFLTFGLLIFTRIEGLAFLLVAIILFFLKFKNHHPFRILLDKKIIFLFFAIITLYGLNIFIDWQFFISIAKAVLKPFLESSNNSFLPSNPFFSIWQIMKIFYLYGLLLFFLLGLAGFALSLRERKIRILIPFLIILPAFIYVIYPNISGDHPWMLRRFMFAIIPVSILYSVIFLEKFFRRKIIIYAFLVLFLAGNLLILLQFLRFIPNQNLLAQIEKISHNFKETDLILIDQKATGENWAMMSGPMSFLYGLQAIYFFNPQDLEKIDLEKFSAVYFIIPNDNLDFYSKDDLLDRLEPVENYFIENITMEKTSLSEKLVLPKSETHLILGKIYLLK